ncbi:MAG TPA: hydrogenase assembly protein HypC [Anaerolineaceae bacterium]|nr:MAG: hydrogenase assembly protein HypC [Chloroflexi bacterium GWB2_54_36]HAL15873.1 hydrogenase assembly protein HypC [Anaerolineaceae bacterium]HBA90395.1 hydrogenase assembly protein HypC [Anaerolineaceae bacterium]HBA90844.1 hydrogenase assembly protein HypC [Anaerolineaceae bacterium]
MCLGIPGKIVELYEQGGLKMAKIDFGGVLREACMEAAPDALVGEYAIIHAGFALNILSEEDALETLRLLEELGQLAGELDPESVMFTSSNKD